MKPNPIYMISAVLLIAACGGGGGEQVAGIDGRGAPPSAVGVVSLGTITGFGSVIVNGQTFNTNNATFTIDGSPGVQSDLAVGDVVLIEGTITSGGAPVASSVTFDDAVEGPISSIDLAAQTLTVLGQLVRIDAATSFDDGISPNSLEALTVGEIVEVSGFLLADGSIGATRIERKVPGGELELTGAVGNAGAATFEINGFVVDYSAAMLSNFPNGAPENGQRVEAKGDLLVNGVLVATAVEFKGDDFGDDGDEAEVEGYITVFNSASDFAVEGVRITTNAQTAYENGTSGDLAVNRKVEVEGEINASGVLVADSVEFKPTGELRIESLVEDVQANQLTVLGIIIAVNASTRFEDDSDADLEIFNLSNVAVGDYVEIRAYDDGGTITATLLERDEDPEEVALRGFVESIAEPNFVILGVTITTDAGTSFTDNDGVSDLTAGQFFGQAAGRLVEASGTLNGGIIEADGAEFEN
jgi:hypothetical protein